MRRIPVDTARVRFLGTAKTATRAQYAELSDGSRRRVPDAQDKNAEGVPMWVVDVLVDDPDADRAEIAGVKVASWEEGRHPLRQVRVDLRPAHPARAPVGQPRRRP